MIELRIIGCAILLTAAFILGIGWGVTKGQQHWGRIACANYAKQTGRDTRFVTLTYWDGGTCLTPTARGKWIPTDNLREIGGTP